MARKPNYNFERKERERLKAEKLADKAEAKRQQRERDLAEADRSDMGVSGADGTAAGPARDDGADASAKEL